MPNELWEIVRADELKMGDTIIPLGEGGMDKGVVEKVDDHGNAFYEREGFSGCVLGSQGRALRRYSGPSPEVLMRAMRLMHFALYDENLHVPMAGDPQNYIRQAEAEIAAETEGGAK